ncbi:MAG: aminopeptidase [Candidatus Bipolaricaulia bacterium]
MIQLELAKAARTIIEYICNLREGEEILIYADTAADLVVAKHLAEAAHAAGGSVSLILYGTRPEVDMEPPAPLAAAMKAADLLIELAEKYIIHTEAYLEALKTARILCLTGVTTEMMKRCIAEVNYPKMLELGDALVEVLRHGNRMEIKTPAGTELSCELGGRLVEHNAGRISSPGEESFLGGQVSWYPVERTIEGTVVFDGSLWPPEDLGLLKRPIRLSVKGGEIKDIEGGPEAERLRGWLEGFNDPRMVKIAHFSYGFNPGAHLSGKILEDERVFGCIEIGIGSQVPSFEVGPASAHTDGIMLNPTVILDGEPIEEGGQFIHPKLTKLADALLRGRKGPWQPRICCSWPMSWGSALARWPPSPKSG